jgi:two-component system NtrC family sensor kinase
MRGQNQSFQVEIIEEYGEVGRVSLFKQNIGRVFLNILNNAFYATYEKKLSLSGKIDYKPEVVVRTNNRDKDIVISIEDNGGGIPNDVISQVFHPFFTTKPPGTGLGLSISYDIIVQEHNGKIDVETQEGLFTKFVISFPKNN